MKDKAQCQIENYYWIIRQRDATTPLPLQATCGALGDLCTHSLVSQGWSSFGGYRITRESRKASKAYLTVQQPSYPDDKLSSFTDCIKLLLSGHSVLRKGVRRLMYIAGIGVPTPTGNQRNMELVTRL